MRYLQTSVLIMIASIFLGGCTGPQALERDAVVVDPAHYTVDFENDKVRVIRIRYGPGEKSTMHQHQQGVLVFLTDHKVNFTNPDGSSQVGTAKSGQTLWSPATEHLPQNVGDKPLELIYVEVKSPGSQPQTKKGCGKKYKSCDKRGNAQRKGGCCNKKP